MSDPDDMERLRDRALLWDAVERWRVLVRLRRDQFERLRTERPDPDAYWARRAGNFFEAVRRRQDPGPFVREVVAACQEAESHGPRQAAGAELSPATVLDVGGGFGAVAVPVAERGHPVTVVEPHPAMLELLVRWATEAGVRGRLRVIAAGWPEAASSVAPHDVVVCSHVLYPIEDVVPFVRALVAATRHACLITLRMAGIEQTPDQLFRELHGEDRVPQPGFGDLCGVLAAAGIPFEVTTFETEASWSYADLDEAEALLSEGLLVADRADARARVRAWAADVLRPSQGRLALPERRVLEGVATLRPVPATAEPGGSSSAAGEDQQR